MLQSNNHCTGVKPSDQQLLVDEVELDSPKGRIILLVCRRCWLISDDEGETWGAPCAFIPGWHPFTSEFIFAGTHGASQCESCRLVTLDCGDTWLKAAELLPRDLPTMAEVLPALPPRHVQLDRTRQFRIRRRIGLSARYAGL